MTTIEKEVLHQKSEGILYSLRVCEGLAHPLPHQSLPKRSASVVQHPQQTALHTTICLSWKEHTNTKYSLHHSNEPNFWKEKHIKTYYDVEEIEEVSG